MRVGIDVTSVRAWRARLARTPAIRATAFEARDRVWCGDDAERFAVAWAVKEATVKLLGCGFEGIGWRGLWSRSSPDGRALEVGLGPEARAVAQSLDLGDGPLRCALARDGDLVVALLAAGAGRVAVRAVRIADGDADADVARVVGSGGVARAGRVVGSGGVARAGRVVGSGGASRAEGDLGLGGVVRDPARARRAGRRHAASEAARMAGTLAARAVGDQPDAAIGWSTTARGAPLASLPDGRVAVASFAHDAGVAVAAVAAAEAPVRAGRSEPKPSDIWIFSYTDDLGNAVKAGLSGRERR